MKTEVITVLKGVVSGGTSLKKPNLESKGHDRDVPKEIYERVTPVGRRGASPPVEFNRQPLRQTQFKVPIAP